MSVRNAQDLLAHLGHEVSVVSYGVGDNVVNVSVECETCNEVLFSLDVEEVEEDE